MSQYPHDALKQCNRCKQFLPLADYTVDKDKKDGLRTLCRTCTKTPKPVLPPVPEGYKRCRECQQIKRATTEFFHAVPAYISEDCLNRQCKDCRNAYRHSHNKGVAKVPLPKSDTKKCPYCKRELPPTLENFSFYRHSADRLNSICKRCSSERSSQFRARSGGKEFRQRYRQSRKEHDKAYRKQYRETHKEYTLMQEKRYRRMRQERDRAYRKRYYQLHKEEKRTRVLHRIARKHNADGTYTIQDIRNKYKSQKGRCYYCSAHFVKGKNAYHIDHIIPLSRGGTNWPDNLVLACPTCNMSKGNKFPHEWAEGGRLL